MSQINTYLELRKRKQREFDDLAEEHMNIETDYNMSERERQWEINRIEYRMIELEQELEAIERILIELEVGHASKNR